MTTNTTPDALRAEAARHEAAAAESFERCDTDGFVSQWAHGMSAQKARLAADIAENGGMAEFPALADESGALVPAKLVDGRYGLVWGLLSDPADPRSAFTGWVNPSKARNAATRKANLAKKGYSIVTVRVPARAELGGSNACTLTAYARRLDGGFSPDAEIVAGCDRFA